MDIKKISVAIGLLAGTAPLDAMMADQMVKMCNGFSDAAAKVTSSKEQLPCILNLKENTKKLEMATKELARGFEDILEILSGRNKESESHSVALALRKETEYCHAFFSAANSIKELPDEQMQLGLITPFADGYKRNKVDIRFHENYSLESIIFIEKWHPYFYKYEIVNGMTGMNRDVILRLLMLIGNPPILIKKDCRENLEDLEVKVLAGEASKVRGVIGMSTAHLSWIGSSFFRIIRRRHEVPGEALPCYRKAIMFAEGIPVKGQSNFEINPVSIKYDHEVYKGARVAVQSAIKAVLPLKTSGRSCYSDFSREKVNLVIARILPQIQAITTQPLAQYKILMLAIDAAAHVSCEHVDPVFVRRHLRELFPTCKEAQEIGDYRFRREDTGGNELSVFVEQLWCLDWCDSCH
ncbi:hypothetical protein FACS189449_06100 [Alphaproteobacteria bacterium]|nr:hypothetical protein FACS189449_06100 [Alphaproteobacteria bacterium]